MLVIFSGGSGVGKNTVINQLLLDEKYDLMPTYTTRDRRENETTGKPYYFISKEEFLERLDAGELYEHNLVHGNYYGASRKLYQEKAQSGKILLKDIDVMGTQNLVNSLGKEVKILTFFFKVDSKEVLVERLLERNEKEIDKRLERYDLEQTYQNKYDYIITNNELFETVGMCENIISFTVEEKYLKATKPENFINESRIKDMAEIMKKDQYYFEPIKATIINGEIYIVDGHHRYLASLSCGLKIAVELIKAEKTDSVNQGYWIKAVQKNKI